RGWGGRRDRAGRLGGGRRRRFRRGALRRSMRFSYALIVYSLQVLSRTFLRNSLLLTTVAAASCRTAGTMQHQPASPPPPPPPPIVQPGAPGQPSKVISAAHPTDLSQVEFTGADIKFMQGLIGHPAHALDI